MLSFEKIKARKFSNLQYSEHVYLSEVDLILYDEWILVCLHVKIYLLLN